MSRVFALLVEYHFEDNELPETFDAAVRTFGDTLRETLPQPVNVTAFTGDEANRLTRHALGRDISPSLPPPPVKRS